MATLRIKPMEIVSDGLIWVAFLCGIAGSFAMSATKLGAAVGHIFGILPPWIVLPAALIGLAMVIFDLKDDGIPNRLRTMYIAVLWPSALLGVDGPAAGIANGWIHGFNDWLYGKIGPAISDDPKHTGTTTIMTTIAVTGIAFALYTAHRYYANVQSAKRAAAATTSTSSTSTPSIPRKTRR